MNELIILLLLFALAGSVTAYRLDMLTQGGAVTAFTIGAIVIFAFHLQGFVLLLMFFGTSTLLGMFKRSKLHGREEVVRKSGGRDAIQVAANGGMAALISLGAIFHHDSLFLLLFVTSLAASNADTWASEVGSAIGGRPYHLFRRTRVLPGASGAITFPGTIASIAGAFVIGMTAFMLGSDLTSEAVMMITLLGFIGAFIDTLIGGTVQVMYVCEQCGGETEKTEHCQRRTRAVKGITWMDNDMVNFISNVWTVLFGAIIFASAF